MKESDEEKDTAPSPGPGESDQEAAPPSEGAAADESDPESLGRALAQEKERAEGYLANWQRAQADLINFRKRVEQEKQELVKYANAALVSSLLPVLDDFERALKSMPGTLMGITWVEGVFLMQHKLRSTLEAHGLSEIGALGEDFDPNVHEAVLYGEGEEGKVVEELQKGYKLHDRVIRPAMVQVGRGKESEARAEDEVEEGEAAEQENES